jgi:hypothetical protein
MPKEPGAIEKGLIPKADGEPRRDQPGINPHDDSHSSEDREDNDPSHDPGSGQGGDGIPPHGVERVDLFRHFHGSKLCRDSSPDSPQHHDGGQDRSQLQDNAGHHDATHDVRGNRPGELVSSLLARDDPSENRSHNDDGDTLDTHDIDLVQDFPIGNPKPNQVGKDHPEEDPQLPGMFRYSPAGPANLLDEP